MRTKIKQALCTHAERHWAYEPARVFTRCANCGKESDGWKVGKAA